jgi:hypothetical protein
VLVSCLHRPTPEAAVLLNTLGAGAGAFGALVGKLVRLVFILIIGLARKRSDGCRMLAAMAHSVFF